MRSSTATTKISNASSSSSSSCPVVLRLLLLSLVTFVGCGTTKTGVSTVSAFIPLLDGGKDFPTLSNNKQLTYQAYFNQQIAKQASAAVSRAVNSGKTNIEVYVPSVPNLDEVRFGTPLNQKFGKTVVAKDLNVKGGYMPGSDISRRQAEYANVYWAKQIAGSVGGIGKSVACLSTEPLNLSLIQNKGSISTLGPLRSNSNSPNNSNNKFDACIVINPGGEEQWDRIRSSIMKSPKSPIVMLNNAYSTSYGLGNQRNYEEAYYLKRISKGWVYRSFPGPWKAYLEKPDGTVELLKSYKTKPQLNELAKVVREESFSRYAITNDRWSPGFGERF